MILIFTSARDSGVFINEIWGIEHLRIKVPQRTVLIHCSAAAQETKYSMTSVTVKKTLACKKNHLKKQKSELNCQKGEQSVLHLAML